MESTQSNAKPITIGYKHVQIFLINNSAGALRSESILCQFQNTSQCTLSKGFVTFIRITLFRQSWACSTLLPTNILGTLSGKSCRLNAATSSTLLHPTVHAHRLFISIISFIRTDLGSTVTISVLLTTTAFSGRTSSKALTNATALVYRFI